jgi:hypothetical protein
MHVTEGQFLHYDGPVAIDGTEFPIASLREHRDSAAEGGWLKSWDGSAWLAASKAPEGFRPELSGSDPVPVELPDGRHGKVLVTNVSFDGACWKLELAGTGWPPGYPQE